MTSEAVTAAKHKAEIALAARYRKAGADDPTAEQLASDTLAEMRSAGWHHTSEHSAPPPPPKPEPPSDEYLQARQQLDQLIHTREAADE